MIRTESDDERKLLPIPQDYRTWLFCKRYKCLPVAGGWLDQPKYLMIAFNIIEYEIQQWQSQKLAVEQANARLREEHEIKHGSATAPIK